MHTTARMQYEIADKFHDRIWFSEGNSGLGCCCPHAVYKVRMHRCSCHNAKRNCDRFHFSDELSQRSVHVIRPNAIVFRFFVAVVVNVSAAKIDQRL